MYNYRRYVLQLLVGIKDINETLVSDTLHTLADLVPVLGASVVIGKGRAKLFADGRPFVSIKMWKK
jgi:SCY1-like protein 3